MSAGIRSLASSKRADLQPAASPGHSLRHRGIAALTALSFVVKLLGVLLLPVPSADPGRAWVPICTVYGLKWIELDSNGQPASDKPLPDRPCPFCLVAAGFPFLLPSTPSLALPVGITVDPPQSWATDAPLLRLAARPPPSRAPPFLTL